jgi:hypothetical protein
MDIFVTVISAMLKQGVTTIRRGIYGISGPKTTSPPPKKNDIYLSHNMPQFTFLAPVLTLIFLHCVYFTLSNSVLPLSFVFPHISLGFSPFFSCHFPIPPWHLRIFRGGIFFNTAYRIWYMPGYKRVPVSLLYGAVAKVRRQWLYCTFSWCINEVTKHKLLTYSDH